METSHFRRRRNLGFFCCIATLLWIDPSAALLLPGQKRSLGSLEARTFAISGNSLFSTSGLFSAPFQESLLKRQSTVAGDFSSEAAAQSQDITYSLHVKVKGKVLTLIGFLFIISCMASCLITFPVFCVCWAYSKLFDQKTRSVMDWCVSLWAKLAMGAMGYRVKLEGAENIPEGGSVLVCPNHTSFLDILTLSAFLPKGFKYVTKREILDIPFIGWSMRMAGHIPVMRQDRRSQLETVKKSIAALKDGNSILMFPEGTRTKNGRLQAFKKGPFSIATKSEATILPVSICNLPKWFPVSAAMPLRVPNDVILRVHPPISAKGVSEEELMAKTFDAIASGLPGEQRPMAT